MKIKAVINSFSALAFGSSVSKKLIRDNRGYKIFLTIEKIGDICLELSYLKRYKQEHPDVKVAIATRSASNPLYKCFPDSYDKLIQITPKQLALLLRFLHMDMGEKFRKKHPELTCLYSIAWARRDLIYQSRGNIDIGSITRAALKLPSDAHPCEIKKFDLSEETKKRLEECNVQRGKTVLLNWVSYSCGAPSMEIFEELAKRLQDMGFTVLTNVVGDQQPVNGTKGLSFPLDETARVLDELGYVIGARSGFVDLACFSDAAVVAIDNESYYASDAYRVELLFPHKSNCTTCRYVEGKTDRVKFIEEVLTYIREH